MDPTAVSAVGNKKQTHIGRADVVVISDFQFIFIAPFKISFVIYVHERYLL